jgi:hypothetical protein
MSNLKILDKYAFYVSEIVEICDIDRQIGAAAFW